MSELTPMEITIRLVVALLFGAIIGWEREMHDRPAGLRTNMLIALGAAACTLVSVAMIDQYTDRPGQSLPIDPTRIVAGIIGGIGFLGAGAILHRKQRIRGMTTAAGIWVVAAVGIASGAGYYLIAGISAALAVFTLVVVRWAEARVDASRKSSQDQPTGKPPE